ncbi:MAG: DNA replication/repair protein RecF [Acidimicrobiales bacterium]
MFLSQLWLTNFRNYENAHLRFNEGITLITGNNGNGKTNLLEAIAWFSKGKSFRGSPNEALILQNEEKAILRAEISKETRKTMLEAEIKAVGKNQIQINGKKINNKKELQEKIKTTIFGPEDLSLIKGTPSERRNYLDELLIDLHVKNQLVKTNFEKCLKQRNTLLKQARGKLTSEIKTTLDVWDEKFAENGQKLAEKRINLLEQLKPEIENIFNKFTKNRDAVLFEYQQLWEKEKLIEELQAERETDIRRGITTIGPHRDEIGIKVNNLLSKNHSSQGEQRSLALGLRLAGHEIVKKTTGIEPIILLDDVFSELDETRCQILIELLPKKQAVLTTTGELPSGVKPDYKYHVTDGSIKSSE